MMLPVVVRCIVGIIPHTLKKELLRARTARAHQKNQTYEASGWPRGEIHSGYWNLVPQNATGERCARYKGLPFITTDRSPFSHVSSVAENAVKRGVKT
jgi:hypothetical protein